MSRRRLSFASLVIWVRKEKEKEEELGGNRTVERRREGGREGRKMLSEKVLDAVLSLVVALFFTYRRLVSSLSLFRSGFLSKQCLS